jgi:membrane protease YdiL (CAAX protease family)
MTAAAPSSTPTPSWQKPVGIAVATTALVTLLSYALPDNYAATGVGLAFLAATYVAVLRRDHPLSPDHYGLALGGLLESEALSPVRIFREAARALGWALGLALVIYPAFWLGYVLWWKPRRPFAWAPPPSFTDEVLGQLFVIALPEEAFYRGFLQTALDDAWKARRRVLGADLGPGLVVSASLFAVGHLLTEVNPNRLAVFFPALVFGWLRVRTRGVGAGIAFHAMCNLFAAYLARSYGMGH